MQTKIKKLILDLCGGTGSWSKPYQDDSNYIVWNITLPYEDVRLFKRPGNFYVHGVLAAPPCTHLAGSGARWWEKKGQKALLEALSVADACLRIVMLSKPKWWALENPVGRLREYYGKPVMYFHPCDYGNPYTKKTALWGDFNIPEKNPVEPVEGSKIHLMPPSEDRATLRSITPKGFAKAFYEANP